MIKKLGFWKKYAMVPVYERSDGLKVHTLGRVAVKDGPEQGVYKHYLIKQSDIEYFRKIVGGKRHRALMAYANFYYPHVRKATS